MNNENNSTFLKKRPDNLCKKCGKCCLVITTEKTYEEILQLAQNNDREALDFLELFEPYKNIEEAKKAGKEIVENISDYQKRTFYRCKFLGENNLCSRYKTRKNICKRFPNSPFAVVPPNCGYQEWLKEEREKIVKKIRTLKQDKKNYLSELNENISDYRRDLLNKLIISIDKYIDMYTEFGSNDW